MAKMIFVNLPVTDLAKATAFYEGIGMINSAMGWSDEIGLMPVGHPFYRTFTRNKIARAHAISEVLLCLSRDSRAEVDLVVEARAPATGGAEARAPQDMGFMYGRAFEDLDHTFEPMWTDVAAMPAASDRPEPVAA